MNALLLRSLSFALVSGAILCAPLTAAAHDTVWQPLETNASSGSTAKPLAADGMTALDSPRTVQCTFETCRIEIDQNVVVAEGSNSTALGLCSKVDGVLLAPCVNLGFVPLIRQTKNFVQYATVGYGHHSLQTFVYTNRGGTAAAWGFNYRIYNKK